ncbi:MAG: exodeoxyribonuclease VII large subunit [Pseudomonadota bacterium]|jgi:exodeoxyribonuclease VII large subunit
MEDAPRWRADAWPGGPATPRPRSTLPGPPDREVWTVSRLNREAKLLLESGLPALWIEGELSNFARPSSGHWYFSLKDAGAQVRCAMFRNANARVRVSPRDGLHVLVRARVSLYEARGDYQLIVEHLEEAGEGALRRRFEELKARLAAEGLFDAERKRALPRLPRCIGVVTSPSGAAVRDVVHVLQRRFPAVPVLIYPTAVQGAGAAAEIAAAIRRASAGGLVDVLIVARGGGSLEDLWSFNDEEVARAIHACAVPVVTGVGHEVDFTIADFVADVRAPTPSGAAELVVPDRAEWSRAFVALERRLAGALDRARAERAARVRWAARRLEQLHPGNRLAERAQRVDELEARLRRGLRRRVADAATRLARLDAELRGRSPAARLAALEARRAALAARLRVTLQARLEAARSRHALAARALHAVSPLATLDRGYSIVERDGRVVTAADAVAPGDTIRARTAKGAIVATVTAREP